MPQTADNLIAIVPKYKFERGPTFMLACDDTGLNWLRDCFLNLSGAKSEVTFVIGDNHPITSDGRFTLIVVTDEQENRDQIERYSASQFTWRMPREEAMEIVEKLDALLTSNIPGHQYFGDGFGPYQTVVVTKGEYPIDLIRAMRDGGGLE